MRGRRHVARQWGRVRLRRPGKDVALAHDHPLDIDELLDQLIQLIAVERELAAEGAHRETPLLLEDLAGALQLADGGHPKHLIADPPGNVRNHSAVHVRP